MADECFDVDQLIAPVYVVKNTTNRPAFASIDGHRVELPPHGEHVVRVPANRQVNITGDPGVVSERKR